MDYNFLKENGYILYEVISGSIAYGTNTPNSDTDIRYVYYLPFEYILRDKLVYQVNDETNDVTGFEISKFLNLLATNNPNILELLNAPEDCIIYKNPIFNLVLNNKNKFISKLCAKSFYGYSISQVKKAKGQDKKQNWEKSKTIRKTPLDFCYIHDGSKSYELNKYLKKRNIKQEDCGLSNVPYGRNVYALYHNENDKNMRGLAFDNSNQLRLSSIPKNFDDKFLGHISYNLDGYTQHCKDYNSYQKWLKERNEARWVDVQNHGQKIDGKNMMHCVRLIRMAKEIARGDGIIVRRPDYKELLDIRKGVYDLETILSNIEEDNILIDNLFKYSNLPETVDLDFVNNLLYEIRLKIYNL